MVVHLACQQLLNESEFANRINIENDNYIIGNLGSPACPIYVPSLGRIIGAVFMEGGAINKLHIYDHDAEILEPFMEFYGIEPYTYTYVFSPSECEYRTEYSPMIKPYNYSPYKGPNPSSLPLCVVSEDENIRSVLREDDEEMGYVIARKLQNGEPITKLKSATQRSRHA